MSEFRSFILDLLYPRYCLGCFKLIDELSESLICHTCKNKIPLKNNFVCAFCSSQVILGKTCPFCRKQHYLDRLLVASNYDYPLVEAAIKSVKYHFVRSLTDDIGDIMSKFLTPLLARNNLIDNNAMIVTAVPLHRRRLNWRGYNQSELIAQKVKDSFGWQYHELLTRTHNNKPQAEIENRQNRLDNIKECFTTLDSTFIKGKNVLLIDDVSTTGSTLDDCARALKGAGVKEVIGFVFARNR